MAHRDPAIEQQNNMHFGCVVLVLYSSILVICWVVACGLLVVVKVVMVVLGPAGPGCRGGRCVVLYRILGIYAGIIA